MAATVGRSVGGALGALEPRRGHEQPQLQESGSEAQACCALSAAHVRSNASSASRSEMSRHGLPSLGATVGGALLPSVRSVGTAVLLPATLRAGVSNPYSASVPCASFHVPTGTRTMEHSTSTNFSFMSTQKPCRRAQCHQRPVLIRQPALTTGRKDL